MQDSEEKPLFKSLSAEIKEHNKSVLESLLDGLVIYEQGVENPKEFLNQFSNTLYFNYKWDGYKVAIGVKEGGYYVSDLGVIDAYVSIAKSLLYLVLKGVENEAEIIPRFRVCIESALSELIEGRAE